MDTRTHALLKELRQAIETERQAIEDFKNHVGTDERVERWRIVCRHRQEIDARLTHLLSAKITRSRP